MDLPRIAWAEPSTLQIRRAMGAAGHRRENRPEYGQDEQEEAEPELLPLPPPNTNDYVVPDEVPPALERTPSSSSGENLVQFIDFIATTMTANAVLSNQHQKHFLSPPAATMGF